MKNRIFSLLLLLSAIGFTSCHKEVNTNPEVIFTNPKRMKIISQDSYAFQTDTCIAVFEDTVTHRQYMCVETYHGVALHEIKQSMNILKDFDNAPLQHKMVVAQYAERWLKANNVRKSDIEIPEYIIDNYLAGRKARAAEQFVRLAEKNEILVTKEQAKEVLYFNYDVRMAKGY